MKKSPLLLFFIGVVVVLSFFTIKKNKTPHCSKDFLKTAFATDPVTLDPRKGGDIISSCAQFMLFEGLTRFSPTSSCDMGVAESIEKNANSTEYVFHLKESFWSDGHPVTAHDFKMAWTSILDPAFPAVSAHLLYCIKNAKAAKLGKCPSSEIGIDVVDDKTLRVTLEYPNDHFLEITSFCVLFPVPSHIVKDGSNWGDSPKQLPISNGPFKITAWARGDYLTFEKNPLYWDSAQVSLKGIEAYIIKDEMSAAHLFQNGQLDFLAQILCPMPPEMLIHFKNQGILKTSSISGSILCVFNTTIPPFSNLALRKAFSLAIDREKLVNHVTQLNEKRGLSIIPPGLKRGRELISIEDYNLALARDFFHKGLEELHISPKDFVVELTYIKASLEDRLAQAIQSFWMNAFDITVKLTPHDYQSTLQNVRNREYEVSLMPWAAQYCDPTSLLERLTSIKYPTNYAGWENNRYKELIHASSYTLNYDAKMTLLEDAEKILAEQLPVTPLYHLSNYYVTQPGIDGVHVAEIGSFKFNWIQNKKEKYV